MSAGRTRRSKEKYGPGHMVNINNNSNNSRGNGSMWRITHKTEMPQIGEVRLHKRTGIMYIYGLFPSRKGERAGWVRFDTLQWKAIGRFPYKIARPKDLLKFPRSAMGLPEGPITTAKLMFK
jgi:hypothetical protein